MVASNTCRHLVATAALTILATSVAAQEVWTDDPLVPDRTPIKAVHFTELRAEINDLLTRCGAAAFSFTDPMLTIGVTPVRALHVTELRAALDTAYAACGSRPPTYSDSTLQAGTTAIRAVHIAELRAAVMALRDPGARSFTLVPSAPRFGPTETGKQSRDRIVVTVTGASGGPVAGATWHMSTDDRSGWVYPAQGTTAANGRISVSWVAGSPGSGVVTLTVRYAGSTMRAELATESVASQRPPHSAVTIWMDHSGRASGYSIDLTPLAEPIGTYYAAINWDGGYAGLQRGGSRYDRQLQFSVWDAPGGGDVRLIERGEGVICRTFGGEGTGQACELNYPWRVGSTYRFEVTEEDLNGGSAMTLHVTDLSTGGRQFVGTLRYATRANLRSFAMFVEDFRRQASTCLAQSVRSAAIRRTMARIGDSWQSITRGTMGRYEEDTGNPGTPPCANRAIRNHVSGLELAMGGRMASDPDAAAQVTIP